MLNVLLTILGDKCEKHMSIDPQSLGSPPANTCIAPGSKAPALGTRKWVFIFILVFLICLSPQGDQRNWNMHARNNEHIRFMLHGFNLSLLLCFSFFGPAHLLNFAPGFVGRYMEFISHSEGKVLIPFWGQNI